MSGNAEGPSVMARDVHGDVVFNAPAEVKSPEEEDLRRRKLQRERRILDDEEAVQAERQRQAKRYVLECRLRKWGCTLLVPVGLVVAVLAAVGIILFSYVFVGILCVLAGLVGWLYNAKVVRDWEAGRMITFPIR